MATGDAPLEVIRSVTLGFGRRAFRACMLLGYGLCSYYASSWNQLSSHDIFGLFVREENIPMATLNYPEPKKIRVVCCWNNDSFVFLISPRKPHKKKKKRKRKMDKKGVRMGLQ